MIRKIVTLLAAIILSSGLFAQTITGHLAMLNNQSIKLESFNGLKTYPISNTTIDTNGTFKLNYSKSDYGVGHLISSDEKPLLVILSGEDEIQGEALSNTDSIKIRQGLENQWFVQYAVDHPRREQALSAWNYLEYISRILYST